MLRLETGRSVAAAVALARPIGRCFDTVACDAKCVTLPAVDGAPTVKCVKVAAVAGVTDVDDAWW